MGLTTGQRRVRVSFNPSQDPIVEAIKAKGAELIDLVDALAKRDGLTEAQAGDFGRNKAHAMTQIEDGVSTAVKAATTFPDAN